MSIPAPTRPRTTPAPITWTNVRRIDLESGEAGPLGEVHVVGGQVSRTPDDSARRIDGQGGIIMPGLWDAHVHMTQWAMTTRWIDVSGTRSAQQAAGVIGEALQRSHHATQQDEVVVGFGFRDSLWPEPPTAEALDATTAGRPVVVLSGDVHSAWANSAAIEHFGLRQGEGLLHEQDAFDLQTRLSQVATGTVDRWVAEAGRAAAAMGVVGIVDLTMDWTPALWRRRFANGFDTLRVRAGIYPQHLSRVLDEGLRGGQLLDESGWLTLGPLKVITDGSLTARTAWCHSPYPHTGVGDPVPGHEHGMCNVPLDQLVRLMMQATGRGMECAIHAIGDRAVSEALEAFSETQARGSIEHAQLVQPRDAVRMAELGLRASVQPAHLLDDREAMDTVWAGRTQDAFPLVTLRAAGVELAFGSDAPVARLDPWLAIEAAVRRASGSQDGWHTEQSLTLSQALMSSTRGVHQLVAGADADLVVLPINPFDLPEDELHTVRATWTMVGGRITHEAD